MNDPLRVAFIGCGAVVEKSHLPALVQVKNLIATVAIDYNETQLTTLSEQYQILHSGTNIEKFTDQFDLAVVATPSASHYEITKTLLDQGKHVLVEKPLSSEYQQACDLVDLAKKANLTLGVSLVRRYLNHYKLFKTLLDSEIIGAIKSFNVEEGGIFNWPVQAESFYQKNKSGGGVLIDTGAHLLDACIWWLGNYATVQYSDDSLGGVEADCQLNLTMESGATGVITMSRVRGLQNSIHVIGEKGILTMHLITGEITLDLNGSSTSLQGRAVQREGSNNYSTVDLFSKQYRKMVSRIYTDRDNDIGLVTGEQSLESIRLIEACYTERQQSDSCHW